MDVHVLRVTGPLVADAIVGPEGLGQPPLQEAVDHVLDLLFADLAGHHILRVVVPAICLTHLGSYRRPPPHRGRAPERAPCPYWLWVVRERSSMSWVTRTRLRAVPVAKHRTRASQSSGLGRPRFLMSSLPSI